MKVFLGMRRRCLTFLLVPLALVGMFGLAACDDGSGGTNVQQADQTQNLSDRDRLCQSIGGCEPGLTSSTELENQKKFYQVMDNPALVGYVYLMSQQGALVYEYQVKGKCSSSESQLTSPTTINTDHEYQGSGVVTIPAPQPDGSYGMNEQGIFCFLNNAAGSVIEFNANAWDWVWSQQRITFPTPAMISIVPNGK